MLEYLNNCRSGGMVYTCDSKSHASRLVGSSPTFGTKIICIVFILFVKFNS